MTPRGGDIVSRITPGRKSGSPSIARFKLHFTPTSASWLNLVERFFAEITRKRIRRGVFTSVADLEEAIHDYLDRHNAVPSPSSGPRPPKPSLQRNAEPSILSKRPETGTKR